MLSLGVARLPWTKSLKQWRDRVLFLRRAGEGVWPDLSDKTLAAMQDELNRARTRLELKIPDKSEPARPYYIQYRVLDLDVRTIVADASRTVWRLITRTASRNS